MIEAIDGHCCPQPRRVTRQTLSQVLREKLVVIMVLREGVLGPEVTTLMGQVVLARLWSAI
jgi:hypothetical protein